MPEPNSLDEMKHFDYFAPTEIIFGAGRVTEAGALAARYGKKAMLVTVPEFPAVAELYAKVKKSLADAGVACVHYDGVIPNPTTELVTRGAELAKAEGVDVVIGLGGGSSMDTAKAIAVEAYLSVNTNPLVECMALDAIRIIAAYLPRALADGSDLEARSQMAWADTLGGLTNASAGVTLPHGLGMQIGGHCPHVTHGQSLAVFYPAFTRYTYPAAEHKFATVGRIFEPSLERESDAVAAERSCDAIDCFLKRIGLWINFRELNVTKEDIREIADCGQVLGDYANNPRVATIPEMYELLMSCYDRK